MSSKNQANNERIKWSKPQILRIDAGSAESGSTTTRSDGGASPNGKNFS